MSDKLKMYLARLLIYTGSIEPAIDAHKLGSKLNVHRRQTKVQMNLG